MPVFWWVGLDLVFLVGRATSSGVLLGVCELSMILGSLSANACGCVSGVQQSDSVIRIIYSFFFRFFSHIGYHRTLSIVSCAIQ